MSQSNSSRSSQGSLPALKKTHYANGNGNHHQSQQLVHPSTQGKFVMDDVISSQGSIKRDVMRNSESVQAVRQESIMLAEKVQHATNLYRQLAARVGKTEERYEMEQKSMGSILGKAKQIEMQLIQQQEQLVSKEGQLALQVHKLQEEVVLLKNEREQYRRQIQSVQTEVRTIADKITHQSGALANGLQDLKSYLDQKEMEKKQELNTTFSTMQGRIDTIEHKTTISQAKTEGRCEKLALQIQQNDKQRQEDVYQIATTIREKEAMTKADVRRLDEKVKVMFEDVMKGSRTSEGKMKTDFDVKFIEIERKVAFDQKDVIRRMSELEEEVASKIKELVQSNREEMDTIASDIQEQLESSQGVENLKREVKHIDKTLQNHQKDIEKVLRAEISSRVSQGDKLNTVLAELKKDNVESLGFLEATFSDHKRKHEESMELVKKELVRYVGETIKANKCAYDETRFNDAEKKMDEMEDALEELAKQEERIGMNSEQLKQIEMENILAQGDMNISIDTNTKELTVVKDSVDDSKKKVKLVEKKLMFLAEAFENYKSENRITPKDIPSRRSTSNSNSNDLDKAREKINKALTLIKDILQLNLIDGDPDTERRKNQKMLKSLERELQYLSDSTNPDSEDENTDNEKDAKENDDKKSDNDEKTDDDNSDEDEPDDSEEEEEESDKEEEGDKKKKKKKDPPPKEKEKDKKKKKDDEAKGDVGKESDDDESDEEPEDDEEWSDDDDDDDDDDESDVGDDGDDDSAKDSDENDDDDNEEEDEEEDEPEKESDGKDKPKNDKKDKKKTTKDDKNEKDKNKKNDKKKKEEKDKDKEKEESDDEEPGNTDDEPDSENEDDPKSDQNDNNKSETEGSDNEDNDKKDEQSDNDKKQRNKKDKPKKSNPSDSDTGSKKSNPSDSETGSKKGGKRKGKNK